MENNGTNKFVALSSEFLMEKYRKQVYVMSELKTLDFTLTYTYEIYKELLNTLPKNKVLLNHDKLARRISYGLKKRNHECSYITKFNKHGIHFDMGSILLPSTDDPYFYFSLFNGIVREKAHIDDIPIEK